MPKDPAFLFYTDDFLAGTIMMSDEQVGKYIRLLCLQHQKGRLSEKHMLSICTAYDEDIWEKFVKDDAGMYYNQRLEDESIRRKRYSESRRKNASGPKKKKINPAKNEPQTSEAYAEHMGNVNVDVNTNGITEEDKREEYRSVLDLHKDNENARGYYNLAKHIFDENPSGKCPDFVLKMGVITWDQYLRLMKIAGGVPEIKNVFDDMVNRPEAVRGRYLGQTLKRWIERQNKPRTVELPQRGANR